MKKLIFFIFTITLFISCSENNSYIDSSIITGLWQRNSSPNELYLFSFTQDKFSMTYIFQNSNISSYQSNYKLTKDKIILDEKGKDGLTNEGIISYRIVNNELYLHSKSTPTEFACYKLE